MLTEYTTPGASVEVRDDESIYSLLTERSIPTTRNKVRFKPIARRSASVDAPQPSDNTFLLYFL